MTIPSLTISNRRVDALSPPLIVAEIGINHGGSLRLLKRWHMPHLRLVVNALNIKLILLTTK